MDLTLAYRGRSTITAGSALALAPNLARGPVGLDATLRHASPFREALAAFAEVVISKPLRPKPKAARPSPTPVAVPEGLEAEYHRQRARYQAARRRHADRRRDADPALWRLRVPCDPVLTVAADAVLLEGFAADESSYACLTIDRDAFAVGHDATLGTTNVDLSPAFAGRVPLLIGGARIVVDPSGFEAGGDREERIHVPSRWLRSFLRLQSSLCLPGRWVPLGRTGLYNVLTAPGPRGVSVRFNPHDEPGSDEIRVVDHGRLHVLGRLLPFLDWVGFFTFGEGLPSFWSARMGPVRLTLGLSSWTSSDLMGPSRFDRLAPPVAPSRYLASQVAASFRSNPAQDLAQVVERSGGSEAETLACLHELAGLGRVVHDLGTGRYRWREWMPEAMTTEVIGREDPETVAARKIAATTSVKLTRSEGRPNGTRVVEGTVLGMPVSMVVDADERIIRGKCACTTFRVRGLHAGLCRHLQATWLRTSARPAPSNLADWLTALRG